jgi:hypothetical protein
MKPVEMQAVIATSFDPTEGSPNKSSSLFSAGVTSLSALSVRVADATIVAPVSSCHGASRRGWSLRPDRAHFQHF